MKTKKQKDQNLFYAGDPAAQPYTIQEAKALAMTATDILTQPHLLEKLHQDFKKGLADEGY